MRGEASARRRHRARPAQPRSRGEAGPAPRAPRPGPATPGQDCAWLRAPRRVPLPPPAPGLAPEVAESGGRCVPGKDSCLPAPPSPPPPGSGWLAVGAGRSPRAEDRGRRTAPTPLGRRNFPNRSRLGDGGGGKPGAVPNPTIGAPSTPAASLRESTVSSDLWAGALSGARGWGGQVSVARGSR